MSQTNTKKPRVISAILAHSNNGVLVNTKDKNKLPWSCSKDMGVFRRMTLGNVVIMGRVTYESLGCKPLPHRINIVLSSTLKQEDQPENVFICSSAFKALSLARTVDLSEVKHRRLTDKECIFIMGGLKVYNDLLKTCSNVIVSIINKDVPCDDYEAAGVYFTDQTLNQYLYGTGKFLNAIHYLNTGWVIEGPERGDALKEVTQYFKSEESYIELKNLRRDTVLMKVPPVE